MCYRYHHQSGCAERAELSAQNLICKYLASPNRRTNRVSCRNIIIFRIILIFKCVSHELEKFRLAFEKTLKFLTKHKK